MAANKEVTTSVSDSCKTSDLTRGMRAVFLWYLPTAALLVGLTLPSARVWLWIPSFLVMGIACLANAARCGRWHCYFTGPVFLLAAAYVAVATLRIVPMFPSVLLVVVLLLVMVAYVAEIPLGKFRSQR
ncbi:MAG: hypothetical protein ACRD2G_03880 [Terriglobia bacterium]